MKKGLLFVLLLASFVGFGQCPDENILLYTQADIDNFAIQYPNCTVIKRLLFISGQDINSLEGLSQINQIGLNPSNNTSRLSFVGCPNLLTLDGLHNIEKIYGSLFIQETGLIDFTGLSQLEFIKDHFSVNRNPNLINFSGMSTSLVYLDSFNVFENNLLQSFEGLESLTEIDGLIQLYILPSLTSLQGLNNLTEVSSLNINTCNSLLNVNELSNLVSLGQLFLDYNDVLNDISGLENVVPENFTCSIAIYENPNLSNCAIQLVCGNFDNPNPMVTVFIANNSLGCDTNQEVEAQCLLSISEADFSTDVAMVPNPVASVLTIEISNSIVFEKAIIHSSLGRRILESSEKQLNLETLSAGIYFVEVVTDRGSVTKKIVKQ